jgi:hypothetical protein
MMPKKSPMPAKAGVGSTTNTAQRLMSSLQQLNSTAGPTRPQKSLQSSAQKSLQSSGRGSTDNALKKIKSAPKMGKPLGSMSGPIGSVSQAASSGSPIRKPLPTPAGRGTPVRKPGPGVMKPAVMPGRKKAY